jgi:type I restriction enzyme R subunit
MHHLIQLTPGRRDLPLPVVEQLIDPWRPPHLLAAEIGPVPASGGGYKPEPELDRLSNIIKAFNDQFGNIDWTDADHVERLITKEIPARVAADTAYQNARRHSDKQNARIEHDKALLRVMTALLQDDTELFKQFSDNPGFRKWLSDMVFGLTYQEGDQPAAGA